MAQNGLKMAQNGLKMASKWPQNGPKRPQNGPKWPQNGPKWPQNGPKCIVVLLSPLCLHILGTNGEIRLTDFGVSHMPEDDDNYGPKRPQNGPKRPQNGQKRPQKVINAQKMPPKATPLSFIPEYLPFIAVAAYNKPQIIHTGDELVFAANVADNVKRKIETILSQATLLICNPIFVYYRQNIHTCNTIGDPPRICT